MAPRHRGEPAPLAVAPLDLLDADGGLLLREGRGRLFTAAGVKRRRGSQQLLREGAAALNSLQRRSNSALYFATR